MDEFLTESDNQDATENILPEIPNGFIRLTHFTSQDIAEKLTKGEDFAYESQGILSSTTDAFSNNDEIMNLIQTAEIGAFRRAKLGDAVVLMDIDCEESKERSRVGKCRDTSVPNHNILGYIRRNNPKELVKNQKYNPIKNKLSYLPVGPLPIQQVKQDTTPVSEVNEGTSDVW